MPIAIMLAVLLQSSASTCQLPDQAVHVIKPAAPQYPDSARDLNLGNVTVLENVSVDDTGKVLNVQITQSSNNMAIDQAAIRAAKASTYEPATHNCTPVSGTYVFRADFRVH